MYLFNSLISEVKWALEIITTNKASGGDGIPVELFQILKDDTVKVLYSTMPADLENSAVATGLEKVSYHFNLTERQCQKWTNYHTIALISHASKVMLKILQARLHHIWTLNIQVFKLVLEKAEEPEFNCQHSLDHRKSKRVPEKHLFLLYWLRQSLWLWKILKEIGIPDHLTCLLRTCMQVRKQQLELDMEQQTGSK